MAGPDSVIVDRNTSILQAETGQSQELKIERQYEKSLAAISIDRLLF